MRKIVYIDENENPVDKTVFLLPFKEKGIDTEEILQVLDRIDYAGGFQLSEDVYLTALKGTPKEARVFLEEATNINNSIAYLRGREYYLHISLNNNVKEVRQKLIGNTQRLQDIIPEAFPTGSEVGLEEKILASSLLDHKRHYSLAFLVGLYNHMLLDPYFDVEVYRKFRGVCERDVDNYYRFLLSGKPPEIEPLGSEELACVSNISLPRDTQRESGTKRLILREMDHPGQLILYSGNLLARDGENRIDVVINPLAGAVDIGFALRSILSLYGIDKIGEVYFIRYSPYGEGHKGQIRAEGIARYIPVALMDELEEIRGGRIFVIDDNAFSGESIKGIRKFIHLNYSTNISISVIERSLAAAKKRKEEGLSYLDPNELDIPVISNWRYVNMVEKEVRRYNFGGKYGG